MRSNIKECPKGKRHIRTMHSGSNGSLEGDCDCCRSNRKILSFQLER